jgi:hypothetical protein
VVVIGVSLLFCVAIYAGLRWRLQSHTAYLIAVAGTLAIWASAFALPPSYFMVLPLVLGMLASVLLGLVGLRAAWVARSMENGLLWLWLLGTTLAVAPLVVVLVRWLRHSPGNT